MRSTLLALMLTATATATPLFAQSRSTRSTAKPVHTTSAATFGVGETLIGPSIGLGGIGEAGMSIGGRFEHGIKVLPDFGNGTLGIGAQLDYYSYSYNYAGGSWKYSYMPIGVTANYHFPISNRKIDPFLGLGLGYSVASVTGGGTVNSGLYLIATAGGRYFVSDKMAVQADIGAGAATLNLGLMFRL